MNVSLRPPRLPDGTRAYGRDRPAYVVRAVRECGDVWRLRPDVYVAASARPCETVLQRTTYEYATFPGTFPPSEAPPPGAPPPEAEHTHGHAARMRGRKPRAVAARPATGCAREPSSTA
ncbi:hypothetical protein [Embleya sp. AB8]|uniref:hypothetical protein n=1 Tax=Embleya sp. AB8 TaxID=3156304 RepID=UPI003C706785